MEGVGKLYTRYAVGTPGKWEVKRSLIGEQSEPIWRNFLSLTDAVMLYVCETCRISTFSYLQKATFFNLAEAPSFALIV